MNTQLVLASLESVLGRRVQTVRALKDQNPELFAKQSESFPRALQLVGQRFHLHAEKQTDTQRAFAMVLILTNYILECQTIAWIQEKQSNRDPLDISLALLRKYPLDILVAAAIKRFDELLALIKNTWLNAKIRTRINRDRWYGITDMETEVTFVSMVSRELIDAQGYPIGTHEEERSIRELMTRVKEETRLANMIDWSLVLDPDDVSKFVAAQFLRSTPMNPHPAGGVWRPFLCSLLVNAMGGGWDHTRRCHVNHASGTELFVCVDLYTMKRFLHRVMLEPESLPSPAEVAAKFATLTFQRRGKIFKEICNEQDLYALLEMAQQAFEHMTSRTREFYFKVVKDIEHVDDAELMTFWGHWLFAYIPAFGDLLLDENRARLEQPWREIHKIRSLEQLADRVARFDLWPKEEQEKFIQTFKLEPLLRTVQHVSKDVEAFIRIWTGMRKAEAGAENTLRLIAACRWYQRSALVIEMCHKSECGFFVEELHAITRRVRWTHQTIPKIIGTFLSSYILADVLELGTREYSQNSWRTLIVGANAHSQEEALIIWDHLSDEQRKVLYTNFYPQHLAAWFLVKPSQVFRDFFEKILEEASRDPDACTRHIRWVKGILHQHSFVPGGVRENILEELWQRYLHRRF